MEEKPRPHSNQEKMWAAVIAAQQHLEALHLDWFPGLGNLLWIRRQGIPNIRIKVRALQRGNRIGISDLNSVDILLVVELSHDLNVRRIGCMLGDWALAASYVSLNGETSWLRVRDFGWTPLPDLLAKYDRHVE